MNQVQVAKDKAMHNLNRQRRLEQEGGKHGCRRWKTTRTSTASASAAYDNAKATARNVIAMAIANWVARDQAQQTLNDMTIRVPRPEMAPPGASQADTVIYAITKRSVSEGQMIKEGESGLSSW